MVIILLQNEKIESLGNGIEVIVSKEHIFNTDTILLADFSSPLKNDIVCELGTGCCAIPLWWSRNVGPKSTIAVEIQKEAYDMACRSVILNKLEDKIKALHIDLNEITNADLKLGSFDVVVCNPPYKPIGTGLKNTCDKRKIARHEEKCSIEDIVELSAKLLKYGGKFCLCSRPERLCDIISAMRKYKIEPKILRFVQHRKDKSPKLFLIEGKKEAKSFLNVMPTLFIEDENGDFSDEMKKIYGYYGENR